MLVWFLTSRVGRWVAAVLAGVAAVGAAVLTIWKAARRSASKDAEIDALTDYRKGRKEMDDADVSTGDADDDERWLRERAKADRRM